MTEPVFGDFDEVATSILREDFYNIGNPLSLQPEIILDSFPSSVRPRTIGLLNETGGTPNIKDENTMDEKVIERVMSFVPQAQGMNPAELLMLAKNQGGGFGEGGNGMMFLLFILLLSGRNGGGLFGAGDAAAAGLTASDLQNINTQITALATNQNAGFADVAERLCATNGAIAQSKYDLTVQLSALGTQMQNCCCNIEREIERSTAALKEFTGAGFNSLQSQATQNQFANIQSFNRLEVQAAADKCEVLGAIGASTNTILSRLNQDKFDSLAAENAALKLGASQLAQTQQLEAFITATCGKKNS